VNSIIRKTLCAWQSWRLRKALYRQCPELRYFDQSEAAAKRSHRNVTDIQAARKATITSLLAGKGRAQA
jgi:hypothetical protein